MMTKSHPDSDRPWPRMFNNSEAGSAWKENLTITLLSLSPSLMMDGKYFSVQKKKNGEGKGEEYLETENIWSAEEMKEKGEGKAPEAGSRARAIITKSE